jgi:hypothetical protein
MLPHRIRLRGPWQITVNYQSPRTISLAGSFPVLDAAGSIEWIRTFGRPGRLDAHERLWLYLDSPAARSSLEFNDVPLGIAEPHQPWETDVTPFLREHNRLRILQTAPPLGWREVGIEIRALAFLRDVKYIRTFDPTIADELQGTIQGPIGLTLDVYVLDERTTRAYQQVVLIAETTPFRIRLPLTENRPNKGHGPLRVELVAGSVPWHVISVPNE